MSYITVEQIRRHLVFPFPVADPVRDQRIEISTQEYTPFYSGAIDESSLQVKSLNANGLSRKTMILAAGPNALSSTPVAWGSVVVASDSSLGTLYTENSDYVIDYRGGALSVKSGGGLVIGQTITVWYAVYHLYERGIDFEARGSRGDIRALASGDIADGQTVLLDYTPLRESLSEENLAEAVAAANGLVEREVDPDRQFGADPTLRTAATFRALEMICRTAATRELSQSFNNDKAALAWLKLADDNALQSDKLMRSFRRPQSGPSTPRHT